MLNRSFLLSNLILAAGLAATAQEPPRMPMQARYADGAEFRWLNKPVIASRLLDGMEDLSTWSFKGTGEMTLSGLYAKEGGHSLRISSLKGEAEAGPEADWHDLLAIRSFPGEDWRSYNRISLWVYPDVAGAPAISCSLTLHNDGAHKLPDRYNEGRHESLILNNHAWNRIVWEIAPLDRDRVTALEFGYSLPKKYPDPGDHTILYIDRLELETVTPDHVEGWDVAPGNIAFSHSGYTAGSPKSAIASGLSAREFSILRQDTGEVVATKAVQQKKTPLGDYQVLDFTEIRQPGTYAIRAGDILTRPFADRRRRLARQHLEGDQLHVQRALRHGDSRDSRPLPPGLLRRARRQANHRQWRLPRCRGSARPPATRRAWSTRCCRSPTA